MNIVGNLYSENVDYLAFYIQKRKQYGMLLDTNWYITYFNYDYSRETNFEAVLGIDMFRQSSGLISWYYDYVDGSFLAIT